MNIEKTQGKGNKVVTTQEVKYKDTIHNIRYNIEVTRYLINELKNEMPTGSEFIEKLNELYELTHGYRSEVNWITALCSDNAEAVVNYLVYNEVCDVSDEVDGVDSTVIETLNDQVVYAELEGKTMDNLIKDFKQH